MFTMSIGRPGYRADLPTPEYLVDEMINTSGLVILGAKPKVGLRPTFRPGIRIALMCLLARRDLILDRTTKQGPVLLAAFEEDPSRHPDARLTRRSGVTRGRPDLSVVRPTPENAARPNRGSDRAYQPRTSSSSNPMAHLDCPPGPTRLQVFRD